MYNTLVLKHLSTYSTVAHMLQKVLMIAQAVLSCLLITVILLQQKGSGMGAAFGGSSNIYSTKRGIDKTLYQATIVIGILFLLIAISSLVF